MPLPVKKRLYLVAAINLVTGLVIAGWIYLAAVDDPAAGMVDEFLNSKKYTHELAVYGGKLTVLADEFSRWFTSLWQGRQLAFTIASITIAISLGIFLVGCYLQRPEEIDKI